MDRLDLARLDRPLARASGGERNAPHWRAPALDPELLLLDETDQPSTSLASGGSRKLLTKVRVHRRDPRSGVSRSRRHPNSRAGSRRAALVSGNFGAYEARKN
jgi:hypothetical protein